MFITLQLVLQMCVFSWAALLLRFSLPRLLTRIIVLFCFEEKSECERKRENAKNSFPEFKVR